MQDNVGVHRGSFPYLISTVNVQRFKKKDCFYSLDSEIAKPDFQP